MEHLERSLLLGFNWKEIKLIIVIKQGEENLAAITYSSAKETPFLASQMNREPSKIEDVLVDVNVYGHKGFFIYRPWMLMSSHSSRWFEGLSIGDRAGYCR
ncbi:hypothetical protein BRADI_1g21014v3 [Brachypodium distachyon]|uniref:Uncharacterized protein n=1 Tax=Brachypodium distachyon TaxID=15368 RepID=A0A2K2DKB2_BRADI|nr:hypothetical protein BRADI_1g21014v3 [Brachypodium distachyon]